MKIIKRILLDVNIYIKNIIKATLELFGYRIIKSSIDLEDKHKKIKTLRNLIKLTITLGGYKVTKFKIDSLEEYFKKNKHRNLIIFDVGANVGESANQYTKKLKYSVVYSFEPIPIIFQKLVNNTSSSVRKFNFGLSNFDGQTVFHVNKAHVTSSLLELSVNAIENWNVPSLENSENLLLEFRKLDSILEELNVDNIDFLKIDVQGAEFLVLEGAENSFLNKRINYVQMEFIYINTYEETKNLCYYLDFFSQYNYDLVSIFDLLHNSKGELLQCELLFRIRT